MTSPNILSIATPHLLKTTKEINGFWGADMLLKPDDYIEAESYVDIDSEEYVVKSLRRIKDGGKYYYNVKLYHNAIEELSQATMDRFYITDTIENIFDYIIANATWTIGVDWSKGTIDIDDTILLYTDRRISVLEALNMLADKCSGELYYHSKTRVIDLKSEIGTATYRQIRYDKNSGYMEKEEDSSNLVTRIYPYDADNTPINAIALDDCEDETLYTASGAGSTDASTYKRYKAQGIEISSSTLNETFIRDLGVGYEVDLSGYDSVTFMYFSEDDNTNGFTFGIGEAAYDENTVNTGAVTGDRWYEITLDISGVADASKNAIRYIGFKNLTGSAVVVVFDRILAFNGNQYLDSPNLSDYKVRKESVYIHSSTVQSVHKTVLIYPSKDTCVYENSPDANYGSNSVMYVRGPNTKIYEIYVAYDLSVIPDGATITLATLYFDVISTGQVTRNITTFRVNADWAEDTITWNNKAAVTGSDLYTWDFASTGWKDSGTDADILDLVQKWYSGEYDNYGIRLKENSGANSTPIGIATKESSNKPYLKVVYTLATDPSALIKASAQDYLYENDEPKLKYKVRMADLSKVIVDTWQDETINIGDTLRVYDNELGINTNCRAKKIVRNLLDPTDIKLELTNKSYSISDSQAKILKQLSYLMPFADNENISNANAIQQGYFGSDVNV